MYSFRENERVKYNITAISKLRKCHKTWNKARRNFVWKCWVTFTRPARHIQDVQLITTRDIEDVWQSIWNVHCRLATSRHSYVLCVHHPSLLSFICGWGLRVSYSLERRLRRGLTMRGEGITTIWPCVGLLERYGEIESRTALGINCARCGLWW
jgi:hypothetical protein